MNLSSMFRRAAKELARPSAAKVMRDTEKALAYELAESKLRVSITDARLSANSVLWLESAIVDDDDIRFRSAGLSGWEWAWESEWA